MRLSEIKREADLVIIDLGETGRTEAEKTQRFIIQETAKVKGIFRRIWKFITGEKELVEHTIHSEVAISKQIYFATQEAAEAYKAKVVKAYKGIEEKLKSI